MLLVMCRLGTGFNLGNTRIQNLVLWDSCMLLRLKNDFVLDVTHFLVRLNDLARAQVTGLVTFTSNAMRAVSHALSY